MANKIEYRVGKLEIHVAEHRTVLKSISDSLERLDGKMEGLDHVIRGNGSPGLAATAATVALRLDSLESSRNKWRDLFFTVAGCVVGGLILFLIQQQWSQKHDLHNDLPTMQQKP